MPQTVAGLNSTPSGQKDWKLKQGGEHKPGKILMVRESQESWQSSRSEHSWEFRKRGEGGKEREGRAGGRQWETDGQRGGQAIRWPSRASSTPVWELLHQSWAWLSSADSESGFCFLVKNKSSFGKKLLINKLVKIKRINHIIDVFIFNNRRISLKSWMSSACSPGTYYW